MCADWAWHLRRSFSPFPPAAVSAACSPAAPASRRRAPSAAAMGMLYTGAMDKGQMHGKGSLVYQNNEKYEGDFEHGTTYHAAHGAGPALDLGH